jgi:hypothetical protein
LLAWALTGYWLCAAIPAFQDDGILAIRPVGLGLCAIGFQMATGAALAAGLMRRLAVAEVGEGIVAAGGLAIAILALGGHVADPGGSAGMIAGPVLGMMMAATAETTLRDSGAVGPLAAAGLTVGAAAAALPAEGLRSSAIVVALTGVVIAAVWGVDLVRRLRRRPPAAARGRFR